MLNLVPDDHCYRSQISMKGRLEGAREAEAEAEGRKLTKRNRKLGWPFFATCDVTQLVTRAVFLNSLVRRIEKVSRIL